LEEAACACYGLMKRQAEEWAGHLELREMRNQSKRA
jgi:hypothetical protein